MRRRPLAALLAALLLTGCGSAVKDIREAEAQRDAGALMACMKDERSFVRERAARALGNIVVAGPEHEAAAALLLSCLKDPGEKPYVRAECAVALSNWREAEAVEPLADALASETDPEARLWMLLAVARFDSPRARSALEAAVDDPDVYISTAARRIVQEKSTIPIPRIEP